MKISLILIVLFPPLLSWGQVKSVNLSSKDTASRELFIFFENYLELRGTGYPLHKIRLSLAHGNIEKSKTNQFIVHETEPGEDTLYFYLNKKLIHSEVYLVKTVGNTIAQLSNISDSSISVLQITSNPFLAVAIPGSNYNHFFRVISFRSEFQSPSGEPIAQFPINSGPLLSQQFLDKVTQLKTNDRIIFSDIRSNDASSRITTLPDLHLTIK